MKEVNIVVTDSSKRVDCVSHSGSLLNEILDCESLEAFY